MSIRITIVSLFIATFVIYAWKDWFKSLCVLLLFTGIHMDRSIPTGMLGIQGLNHWNILFIGVLLGWRLSGRTLRLAWDAPVHTTVLFLMFLGVILVGMLRAILDRSHIEGYPLTNLISDRFINTIKWTVPGLLLFHGCRTRKQVVLAIMAICGMYLILALQVVYRVPWQCALGEASDALFRARGKACRRIGYNACDVSAFLSGASWGILAVVPLVRQKRHQVLVLAAAGIVTFGQALTGGRAGYLAWLATGSVLCLLKWRKYLLLAPVVVVLLLVIFPGVTQRMLTGLGQVDASGQKVVDEELLTAGRATIWPYVIEKIRQSPWIGHGQLAMARTGLTAQIELEAPGTGAPHPHNLYLWTLLDNGILGSLPFFLLWGTMLVYAGTLFVSHNRLYSAAGGLALSMMLAQLFAGIGAQRIYPVESTVGVWASMFLMLRVYVEEMKRRTDLIPADAACTGPSWEGQMAVASVYPPVTTTRREHV